MRNTRSRPAANKLRVQTHLDAGGNLDLDVSAVGVFAVVAVLVAVIVTIVMLGKNIQDNRKIAAASRSIAAAELARPASPWLTSPALTFSRSCSPKTSGADLRADRRRFTTSPAVERAESALSVNLRTAGAGPQIDADQQLGPPPPERSRSTPPTQRQSSPQRGAAAVAELDVLGLP